MQKMLEDEDDMELGLGSSSVQLHATEEVHDASMLSVDLNWINYCDGVDSWKFTFVLRIEEKMCQDNEVGVLTTSYEW